MEEWRNRVLAPPSHSQLRDSVEEPRRLRLRLPGSGGSISAIAPIRPTMAKLFHRQPWSIRAEASAGAGDGLRDDRAESTRTSTSRVSGTMPNKITRSGCQLCKSGVDVIR